MAGYFTCKRCDTEKIASPEFQRESELDDHIRYNHMLWTPYQCAYCDCQSPSSNNLQTHATRFHPGKIFKVIYTPNPEKESELVSIKRSGQPVPPQNRLGCNVPLPQTPASVSIQRNYPSTSFTGRVPANTYQPHPQNYTSQRFPYYPTQPNNLRMGCFKSEYDSPFLPPQYPHNNQRYPHAAHQQHNYNPNMSIPNNYSPSFLPHPKHSPQIQSIQMDHRDLTPGRNLPNKKSNSPGFHPTTCDNTMKDLEERGGVVYSGGRGLSSGRVAKTEPFSYTNIFGSTGSTTSDSPFIKNPGQIAETDKPKFGHDDVFPTIIDKPVLCKQCHQSIAKTHIEAHVWRHYNVEIFLCSVRGCSFASNITETEVQNHIDDKHKTSVAVVLDHRKKYTRTFEKILKSCFPKEDNRQIEFLIENEKTREKDKDDHDSQQKKKDASLAAKSGTTASAKTKIMKKRQENPFVWCKICTSNVGKKKVTEHVLLRHIQKPGVRCPYCDFNQPGRLYIVRKHMETHHADQPITEPIDDRHLFTDQIREFVMTNMTEKAEESKKHRCHVCKKEITKKKLHILIHHLRKKVFKCSYDGCEHSCVTRDSIRAHVKKAHSTPWKQPTTLFHLYKDQFSDWMANCFPRHQSQHSGDPSQDVVAADSQEAKMLAKPATIGELRMEDKGSITSPTETPAHTSQPSPDTTKTSRTEKQATRINKEDNNAGMCMLCKVYIPHKTKHVYSRHLEVKVYKCPHKMCRYSARDIGTVKRHISTLHQKKGTPLDHSHMYATQIHGWMTRCFKKTHYGQKSKGNKKKTNKTTDANSQVSVLSPPLLSSQTSTTAVTTTNESTTDKTQSDESVTEDSAKDIPTQEENAVPTKGLPTLQHQNVVGSQNMLASPYQTLDQSAAPPTPTVKETPPFLTAVSPPPPLTPQAKSTADLVSNQYEESDENIPALPNRDNYTTRLNVSLHSESATDSNNRPFLPPHDSIPVFGRRSDVAVPQPNPPEEDEAQSDSFLNVTSSSCASFLNITSSPAPTDDMEPMPDSDWTLDTEQLPVSNTAELLTANQPPSEKTTKDASPQVRLSSTSEHEATDNPPTPTLSAQHLQAIGEHNYSRSPPFPEWNIEQEAPSDVQPLTDLTSVLFPTYSTLTADTNLAPLPVTVVKPDPSATDSAVETSSTVVSPTESDLDSSEECRIPLMTLLQDPIPSTTGLSGESAPPDLPSHDPPPKTSPVARKEYMAPSSPLPNARTQIVKLKAEGVSQGPLQRKRFKASWGGGNILLSRDRPVKCAVCSETMKARNRHRHVYVKHMKTEPFLCPHCHITSMYEGSMTIHITRIHPEKNFSKPVNTASMHATEHTEWMKKCFPLPAPISHSQTPVPKPEIPESSESPSKSLAKTTPTSNTPQPTTKETPSSSNKKDMHHNRKRMKKENGTEENNGGRKDNRSYILKRLGLASNDKEGKVSIKRETPLLTGGKDGAQAKKSKRVKCRECKYFVNNIKQNKARHIFSAHLKIRCFRCPHCSFSCETTAATVLDHMNNIHRDIKEQEAVIDVRSQFSVDLRNWMELCFSEPPTNENPADDRRTTSTPDSIRSSSSEESDSDLNDKIKCLVCDKVILKEDKVQHIKSAHLKMKQFSCLICEKVASNSVQQIQRHIRRTHPDKPDSLTPQNMKKAYQEEIGNWVSNCYSTGSVQGTTSRSISTSSQQKLTPALPTRINQPTDSAFSERKGFGTVNRSEKKSLVEELDNKITCRLCNVNLAKTSQAKQRHIAKEHLKTQRFKCPLCTYTTSHSRSEAHRHMKASHNKQREPIDMGTKYREEMDLWLEKCFAQNDIQAPRKDALQKETIGGRKELVRASTSGGKRSDAEKEDEHKTDTENKEPDTRIKCKECHKRVRPSKNLRHIFEDHLKISPYRCPKCPYVTTRSLKNVSDHITSKHFAQRQTLQPSDASKMYRKEIEGWFVRCFASEILKSDSSAPSKKTKTENKTKVDRKHVKPEASEALPGAGGEKPVEKRTGATQHELPSSPFLVTQAVSTTPSHLPSTPMSQTEDKMLCSVCKDEIDPAFKNLHVVLAHVTTGPFRCPVCPANYALSATQVHKHIHHAHFYLRDSLQPVDFRTSYQKEVEGWLETCFQTNTNTEKTQPPEPPHASHFQLPQLKASRPSVSTDSSPFQTTMPPKTKDSESSPTTGKGELKRKRSENKSATPDRRKTEGEQKKSKEDKGSFSSRTTSSSNKGHPPPLPNKAGEVKKCLICGETVSGSSRTVHVLRNHVHFPVLGCPMEGCTFSLCWNEGKDFQAQHAKRAHRGNKVEPPFCKLSELPIQNKFKDVFYKCYGQYPTGVRYKSTTTIQPVSSGGHKS